MTEETLNILIKLLAYISSIRQDRNPILVKSYVEVFLSQQFSANTVSNKIQLFETELALCEKPDDTSENYQKTVKTGIFTYCNELNKSLTINQKFLVLINLLGFVKLRNENSKALFLDDCIIEIADIFKIDTKEFNNCKSFTDDKIIGIEGKNNILVFTGSKISGSSGIRYSLKEGLKGYIRILKIDSIHSYLFIVSGDDHLEINDRHIFKHHVYFFHKGSSIQGSGISPLYFSDVEQSFIKVDPDNEIILTVDNLEYIFHDNTIGIHKLSLVANSGQMVAIMGGSGTGKSTFINLLNSNLIPTSGNVFINGIDIHKNKEQIQGLIGYVPQDDVLFEDLTVYQNLYYNSKLCFGTFDNPAIEDKINYSLKSLDMEDIRHLKVGTPLNKFISGGQRKRLNIAMELIREPSVLFVDEPTSGLSSADSIKVIELLKEQALNGKLVFINVHQPSSEIFKLFDRLLVFDKGGYSIYWGNPVESLHYFKKSLNLLDADQNECLLCGNVNPEEILLLTECKKINEYGKESEERKNTPEKWYNLFQLSNESNNKIYESAKNNIPEIYFQLPSKIQQFRIFSIRNISAKFTDKQYVIISLIEAPLLAVILGIFMRQTDTVTHNYDFSKNENLPSYLFMSIIVALFIGLIVSSDEIIKDRKILRRESFLGLSRTSFINSKVFYLFVLSFIQMLLYVLIGNYILDIKGMTFSYCLVLWSVACFANMLGLNISNSFKSVITIYITIPFLLIPQILLAGVVVNYDKLHHSIASQKYVPVIGDFMVSRWGYEALAVDQFNHNKYQNLMSDYDLRISDKVYQMNIFIPALIDVTDESIVLIKKRGIEPLPADLFRTSFGSRQGVEMNKSDNKQLRDNLMLLSDELKQYAHLFFLMNFHCFDSLQEAFISKDILIQTSNFLEKIKKIYLSKWDKLDHEKEVYLKELTNDKGREFLIDLKKTNFNEKLSDLVLDNNVFVKYIRINNEIIRKFRPIYFIPESHFGRSHFYAPVKRIGSFYIDTFWFNVGIIWIITCVLYIVLLTDIILKIKMFFVKSKLLLLNNIK